MVILPLVPQFSRMLQRNLLYTAVTRAEQMLILLGDIQAFERSVTNESVNRQTTLTKRLQQVFGGDSEEMSTTAVADSSGAAVVATDNQQATGADAVVGTATENEHEEPAGPKILTPALVRSGRINPMIGMSGIKPTDFMAQVAN